MQAANRPDHNDSSDTSDSGLARRIAGGDQHAFVLLMRRHNQLLYRTARSILRDDFDAEDALQDAYLQAYRAIGQFRADAKLATWLTRIVINAAIARSRKTGRRAGVSQLHHGAAQADYLAEATMEPGASDSPDSPETGAMRAQTRAMLEKSIDALPEVFRTVFVLRALEEMSCEEVAACLDIPEATVRSRFFRARGMLRAALAHDVDLALEQAFSFDGARCDRIVAGVLERLRRAGPGDA
ncbi:MAG: polymerase sigma factor [Massilia sp.]|jgi:RNA polymerase sigma-70 factor (ECF subfamily)|nr:polymerase sigma factor [Massilia sp.]MDB5952298.1 polymerase sigma factor [Massilia sp.]